MSKTICVAFLVLVTTAGCGRDLSHLVGCGDVEKDTKKIVSDFKPKISEYEDYFKKYPTASVPCNDSNRESTYTIREYASLKEKHDSALWDKVEQESESRRREMREVLDEWWKAKQRDEARNSRPN